MDQAYEPAGVFFLPNRKLMVKLAIKKEKSNKPCKQLLVLAHKNLCVCFVFKDFGFPFGAF